MRTNLKCIYLTEKSRGVVMNEHETFIEVPVNRGLATQPLLHVTYISTCTETIYASSP